MDFQILSFFSTWWLHDIKIFGQTNELFSPVRNLWGHGIILKGTGGKIPHFMNETAANPHCMTRTYDSTSPHFTYCPCRSSALQRNSIHNGGRKPHRNFPPHNAFVSRTASRPVAGYHNGICTGVPVDKTSGKKKPRIFVLVQQHGSSGKLQWFLNLLQAWLQIKLAVVHLSESAAVIKSRIFLSRILGFHCEPETTVWPPRPRAFQHSTQFSVTLPVSIGFILYQSTRDYDWNLNEVSTSKCW